MSNAGVVQPVVDEMSLAPTLADINLFHAVPPQQAPAIVVELLHRTAASPQAQLELIEKMAQRATADERDWIAQGLLRYTAAPVSNGNSAVSRSATSNELAGLLRAGDIGTASATLQFLKPGAASQALAELLAFARVDDAVGEGLGRLAADMPPSFLATLASAGLRMVPVQPSPSSEAGASSKASTSPRHDAKALRALLLSSRAEQDAPAEIGQLLQSMPPDNAARLVSEVAFTLDDTLREQLFAVAARVDMGNPQWLGRQLAVADALLAVQPERAQQFAEVIKNRGPTAGLSPFEAAWQPRLEAVQSDHRVAVAAERVAGLATQGDVALAAISDLLLGLTPQETQKAATAVLGRMAPPDRPAAFRAMRDAVKDDDAHLDGVLFAQAAIELGNEGYRPHARGGPSYEDFMKDPQPLIQSAFSAYQQAHAGPITLKGRSSESLNLVAGLLNVNIAAVDKKEKARLYEVVDQLIKIGGPHAQVDGMPFVYAVDDPRLGVGASALLLARNASGQRHAVDEYALRYTLDDRPGVSDKQRFADFFESNPYPSRNAYIAMPASPGTGRAGTSKVSPNDATKVTYNAAGIAPYFMRSARDQSTREYVREQLHGDLIAGGAGLVSGGITTLGVVGVATGTALVSAPVLAVAAPVAIVTNLWDGYNSVADVYQLHAHGKTGTFWDYGGVGLSLLGAGEAITLGRAANSGLRAATLLRGAEALEEAGHLSRADQLTQKALDLTLSPQSFPRVNKFYERALVQQVQMGGNLASFGHASFDLVAHGDQMTDGEWAQSFAMLGMNVMNMSISHAGQWWVKNRSEVSLTASDTLPPRDGSSSSMGRPVAQTAGGLKLEAESGLKRPMSSEEFSSDSASGIWPTTVRAARRDASQAYRATDVQRELTDKIKNKVYLGMKTLERQAHELEDSLRKASQLEVLAESSQDSREGVTRSEEARLARVQAHSAAATYRNTFAALEPLTVELAEAELAHAQLALKTITAQRRFKEMQQERNPFDVSDEALDVLRTAEQDATANLADVERQGTDAVRHFNRLVDMHAEPVELPKQRRVLDSAAANRALGGIQKTLNNSADALSKARSELAAATREEAEAAAKSTALWEADKALREQGAEPSQEDTQVLLLSVETTLAAERKVDIKTAEVRFQQDLVDRLRVANQAAKKANDAVAQAGARHAGGETETAIHDQFTVQAGQALVDFDKQIDAVAALVARGFEVKPRRPNYVTEVTYGRDARHPAYPTLPDIDVNEGRGGVLPHVPQWRLSKTPYEKMYPNQVLVPGQFLVSDMLHERAEQPGGLENAEANVHAHDRGYDHSGATAAQLTWLEGLYRAIGQPWNSVERHFFALRPFTVLQGMASKTSRILHGSIPQGCCGGNPHYSPIYAGRLHMGRAKSTDVEMAREYTTIWRNHEKSLADAEAAHTRVQQALDKADAAHAREPGGAKEQRALAEAAKWQGKEIEARARAEEFLSKVARADLSMTGVDPSKPDTVDHARKMLLDHPGVFKFVGELTIKKEVVTILLGKESFEINSAELKRFMKFAEETGLGVLIHCDWGHHGIHEEDARPVGTKTAYEHFDDLIEMLSQFPNANVTLAHTGIGRFVRPDTRVTQMTVDVGGKPTTLEVTEHMAMVYRALEKAPNLTFDISWNDVAQAYINDPDMRRSLVDFAVLFKDRIFFGNDTVGPSSPAVYNQTLTTYLPLFKDIALRSPEALWSLVRGNYEARMAKTEAATADWTERHLRNLGRGDEAVDMRSMHAALAIKRTEMLTGAREQFDAWVRTLYGNLHDDHAARVQADADPSRPSRPTGFTTTQTPVPVLIHDQYKDPEHMHWVGDAHGAGTPRGNAETPRNAAMALAITLGSGVGAWQFGNTLLGITPPDSVMKLHAGAYLGRAGLNLVRTVGTDLQALDWKNIAERGRLTNETLDRFVNHLIDHQRGFQIPTDRLQQVVDLTEQFRVDYAYLMSKPLDDSRGWTETQQQNVVMSAIGEYQISLDRALGFSAASLTVFDPRTRPGQLWRILSAGTLGVNAAISWKAALEPGLSLLQQAYTGGFAAANAASLVHFSAGIGSGFRGFDWEPRGPLRYARAASTTALAVSGGLWALSDGMKLVANPSVMGAAATVLGGVYTYATARQAENGIRTAMRLPALPPSVVSKTAYGQIFATVGRMGLMLVEEAEDDDKFSDAKPLPKDPTPWTPPAPTASAVDGIAPTDPVDLTPPVETLPPKANAWTGLPPYALGTSLWEQRLRGPDNPGL
jgi:hypothetical protein